MLTIVLQLMSQFPWVYIFKTHYNNMQETIGVTDNSVGLTNGD